MQKRQIIKCAVALGAFALVQVVAAQSSQPLTAAQVSVAAQPSGVTAAPAASVVPVQSYTLGDLADMARDVEFEKQRRALREAKGVEEAKAPQAPIPMPVKKKVKVAPKPIVPEGLQVRAIFGVYPNETIRFFTKNAQFEDRHVGETVQGWTITHVADEGVVLQKGEVVYPLAMQTRTMVAESAEGADPEPVAKNAVMAGPLPSPKLTSSQ